MNEKIFRPVILPYWVLNKFELLDILAQAKIGYATHVAFTSSDVADGFCEPIDVNDENPEVVYEEIVMHIADGEQDFIVGENFVLTCQEHDDTYLKREKEVPHYRDLEYRHKKKRF